MFAKIELVYGLRIYINETHRGGLFFSFSKNKVVEVVGEYVQACSFFSRSISPTDWVRCLGLGKRIQ